MTDQNDKQDLITAENTINASHQAGLAVGKGIRFILDSLPLIMMALAAVYFADFRANQKIAALQAELDARPPMAILDYSDLIPDDEKDLTSDHLREVLRKRDEAVAKLSGAGFVVLDGDAVVAAPDSVQVKLKQN